MNNFNQGVLTLFAFLLVFEIFVAQRRKWVWVVTGAVLFSAGSLGAASVGLERWTVSIELSVIMSALCLGYLWFERVTRQAEKRARRHAVKQGITTGDAVRELPGVLGLEKTALARYAVPRKPGGLPKRWSFLRRESGEGIKFPHGWLLTAAEGKPSDAMQAILRGIAAQAREEKLEFEADDKELCAYWKEWGGADRADDVIQWLQTLAQY
ncbi:MAG TPA: hypothetical protein VMF29_06725 [Candidatus Edwardsbacteria bacterium]|nr:hypothetical protein [Candidatus Edwardsbacteria bacterium]